jgi:hypothetical protein
MELGSARQAALDDSHFVLFPHRTDDGQDTKEVWVWKLHQYVEGCMESSTLLPMVVK